MSSPLLCPCCHPALTLLSLYYSCSSMAKTRQSQNFLVVLKPYRSNGGLPSGYGGWWITAVIGGAHTSAWMAAVWNWIINVAVAEVVLYTLSYRITSRNFIPVLMQWPERPMSLAFSLMWVQYLKMQKNMLHAVREICCFRMKGLCKKTWLKAGSESIEARVLNVHFHPSAAPERQWSIFVL